MPYIQDADLPLLFTQKHGILSPAPTTITSSACSILSLSDALPSMGGNNGSYTDSASVNTVAQALEIARDSEEGASDARVQEILEHALAGIWSKVQARPASYVMSRDEFAVFNYFQHRFQGNQLAVQARRRYWDSIQPTNGHHG